MNELLGDQELEEQIESIKVIPSSGGRFEITVNGDLVYSKMTTGRHAGQGEIQGLVKAKIGQ